MYQFLDVRFGGRFKDTPNEIDAVYLDGRKVILFKPLEPYETPDAIEAICDEYDKGIIKKEGSGRATFYHLI